MNQTQLLHSTLKRELRAKAVTYAEVARHLELSENSIKRLFAEQSFSIARLEKVCELVGLDLVDLVQSMQAQRKRIKTFSEEQEKELVADPRMLLVAVCVLHQFSFEDITHIYDMSEHECIRRLAKLDRLKVIDLLPLNRFRLIVDDHFHWRPNGPIQQYFQRNVQADFFHTSFQGAGEKRLFKSGMLSRASNTYLMEKLEQLTEEFQELHRADADLPIGKRFGTGLLLAMREWEFGVFKEMKKKPTDSA